MEENKMNLIEKLSHIQNEMNVKKSQFNKFGNYNYRSAEDILAEAKKVCMKYKTTLIVSDEIQKIDDRFYIKATALLYDWESEKKFYTDAYAREELSKKGMDSSQVTGSCSSYARKYALNGLFNLDDVKDADTDEQHLQTHKNLDELKTRCFKAQNELQKQGVDVHEQKFVDKLMFEYNVSSQDIANMSERELNKLIRTYSEIYKEVTANGRTN